MGDVVDDALTGYYTKRVTEVAGKTASGFPAPDQAERKIRELFSYRLINAKGVRQPVAKEQSGLPDQAITGLRDAYLVREDRRWQLRMDRAGSRPPGRAGDPEQRSLVQESAPLVPDPRGALECPGPARQPAAQRPRPQRGRALGFRPP